MNDLGPLDRPARLFTNTPTVSNTGANTFAVAFAGTLNVTKVRPSTRTVIAGARDASEVEDVFRCRWFDGLGVGMLLDCDGVRYRIVKISEMGRRYGWEIYGRAVQ